MPSFRHHTNFLSISLLFFVWLQLGVVAPLHLGHGSHTLEASKSGEGEEHAPYARSQCDLCLSASTADPGSVAKAPLFALKESYLSPVLRLESVSYPRPFSSALARGPPAYS